MSPSIPRAWAANGFRQALPGLLLALLVLLLPLPGSGQEKPAERKSNKATPTAPRAITIVVRFTDDRILKLAMPREHIRLNTPYGKLLIPIANVRSIDFATRIPDADARRANAAITNLGSRQFLVRRDAEVELLKMREKASPSLHQALKSKDLEVAMRVRTLLNRLSHLVSEDQLEVRAQDVVRTAESRIAGRIEGTALKAYSLPFGKGPQKSLPLSSLRSLGVGIDPRSINALPDPGTLQAFQGQIDKTFWFKVTGSVNGMVWGTKVYTADSPLSAVAVHAGFLKPGQTGVVHVKIVAPLASYNGSNRNGVTSAPYGPWPGAYQLIR